MSNLDLNKLGQAAKQYVQENPEEVAGAALEGLASGGEIGAIAGAAQKVGTGALEQVQQNESSNSNSSNPQTPQNGVSSALSGVSKIASVPLDILKGVPIVGAALSKTTSLPLGILDGATANASGAQNSQASSSGSLSGASETASNPFDMLKSVEAGGANPSKPIPGLDKIPIVGSFVDTVNIILAAPKDELLSIASTATNLTPKPSSGMQAPMPGGGATEEDDEKGFSFGR